MRALLPVVLVLSVPAAFVGCRKSEPTGVADAALAVSGLPASELCELVFGALTQGLATRCSKREQEKQLGYLKTSAQTLVESCKAELAPLIPRDNLRIAAEGARACAREVEAASYKVTLSGAEALGLPACEKLISGSLPEGGSCMSNLECAAGLSCSGALGVGKCARPGPGVSCRLSVLAALAAQPACGAGAWCKPIKSVRTAETTTNLGGPAFEPPAVAAALASSAAPAGSAAPEAGPHPRPYGIDTLELDGIGLGAIGTLGHGSATTSGERGAVVKIRMGTVDVSGRLPPEVIQRIVRQNFGRFRMCWEQPKNPKLEGRVSVKFVIGRDGSVSKVTDGGSDLPDKDVVACVTRTFTGLSFPQPEGGVVKVTYPVQFVAPDPTLATPRLPTCEALHAADATCGTSAECQSPLACRQGKCAATPPAAAGDACLAESDCAEGLYCRRREPEYDSAKDPTPDPALTPGECAARKPDAIPCTSSVQCRGLCIARRCTSTCGAG